jgi:hypothetical protein
LNGEATLRHHNVQLLQHQLLGQALDTDHMGAAIGACLDGPAVTVSVERVLFSPSRPAVIHYRLSGEHAEDCGLLIGELIGDGAEAHCRNERDRLRKARRSQLGRNDRAGLFVIDRPGMVLRRPGRDSKLDGLRLLHDRTLAAHALAGMTGEAVDAARLSLRLMAHRLGKRAVLAADLDDKPRSIIRLRPTSNDGGLTGFNDHRAISEQLKGASFVRVPTACGYDLAFGAAFYSVLPGHPPAQDGADAAHDGALIGHALREFRHRLSFRASIWSPRDELAGLLRWADLIGAHAPYLCDRFETALARLNCELNRLPWIEPAVCHRDFHPGQILIDDGHCGLLDFDTCCMSDPALDVGNLNAHLRLWELRTGGAADAFRQPFLDAASGGDMGFERRRIDLWTQVSLLRLAAIYCFTSEPRQNVEALVAEASA